MAGTIEAFVDQLQADGVQAGQAAAEKIRAEAEQQAERLIAEAQAKAKAIIAEAEAQIEKTRERAETELRLATRDALIHLQETLSRALRGVLAGAAQEQLSQAEFLGKLLRDVVMQYARADSECAGSVTINVSEEMRHQLTHWAIQALHKDLEGTGTNVDLHGKLAGAGFEYRVSGGTVEVTVDSVVEILSQMVSPELRALVARAAANGDR